MSVSLPSPTNENNSRPADQCISIAIILVTSDDVLLKCVLQEVKEVLIFSKKHCIDRHRRTCILTTISGDITRLVQHSYSMVLVFELVSV